jgi:hypothetical protein
MNTSHSSPRDTQVRGSSRQVTKLAASVFRLMKCADRPVYPLKSAKQPQMLTQGDIVLGVLQLDEEEVWT